MQFFIACIYLSTLILFNVSIYGEILLFGSSDCSNCAETKLFLDSNKLEYSFFDVDIDSNYDKLISFEKKLSVKNSGDFPAVVIKDHILYFDIENFRDSIVYYSSNNHLKNKDIDSIVAKSKNSIELNKKKFLVYFYKEGCPHCNRVHRHIKYLKDKYKNLVVDEYSISSDSSKRLNEALSLMYNVPIKQRLVAPSIFFSKGYLVLEDCSPHNIDSLLITSNYSIVDKITEKDLIKGDKSIKSRFNNFSLLTVAFAGLLDGINPCAFATLIFLLTYLILLKKSRKTILISGVSFTLGVFITYFVVGMGFLQLVSVLNKFLWLKLLINIIIVAVMIYFALLNLYDFVMIKQGKPNKVKLELGFETSKKIQDNIRNLSNSRLLYIKTFIVGVVISFLELACTGQVYLPTIVYMKQNSVTDAIYYLLVYNLLFILPIIVVFLLAFYGVETKYFQRFLRKSASSVKLLFFVLLITMALVVFLTQIL